MKINMEFDQLDIPFDMQFGDWLPASHGDPNAVHFIPQALTEEEKAQARQNIGAMKSGMADTDLDMKGNSIHNVGNLNFNCISEEPSNIDIVPDADTESGTFKLRFIGLYKQILDGLVRLCNIADGVTVHDAATVGQLNAIAQKIGVTYVGGINTSNPVALADLTPGAYYLSGTYKKVATEDDTLVFPGVVVQVTPLSADSHTMSWRNGSYILQAEIGNGLFTGPWVYTLQYKENCVTSIDETAEDMQYPSAKAVYDHVKGRFDENCLIVTVDENKKASATAEQIYTHAKNGGTVYLHVFGNLYIPMSVCDPAGAQFVISGSDCIDTHYSIDDTGGFLEETVDLVSYGFFESEIKRISESLPFKAITNKIVRLSQLESGVYYFGKGAGWATPKDERDGDDGYLREHHFMVLDNSDVDALHAIILSPRFIKQNPSIYALTDHKISEGITPFFSSISLVELKALLDRVDSLETQTGNIETSLDVLTEHATYKKLYDRVEITADDVAAAGEEGIMEIAIGSADVDLSPYNDILVKVVIPADDTLNSDFGLLRIAWGVTASGNKSALLSPQSGSLGVACKINHDNSNSFMVKMTFTDDTFLYGQVMKNGYGGSYGYAGVQNCWTEVNPNGKKSEFRYFRVADRFGKFKFPAGTYVEVYGR